MNDLLGKLKQFSDRVAIVDSEREYTYRALEEYVYIYLNQLKKGAIHSKTVALISDYNFFSIALFIALYIEKNIIVPIVSKVYEEAYEQTHASGADVIIRLNDSGELVIDFSESTLSHNLVDKLQTLGLAGLILFSSGSTGKPKAMIHDLDSLVLSYLDRKPKKLSFLIFLMFDHIGGIHTLLTTLLAGAKAVLTELRDASHIAKLIERNKVNVLPASPTFLNLLLIEQNHRRRNLSSLKMITYGTEPMPKSLLSRIRDEFPKVKILQTFGTSETGIITTTSRASDSLELKIDDPNVQYKIVDNELWLRSKTQVLGYLNVDGAGSFTKDGWFKTGDYVDECKDGYIRIMGRSKEVINVGGQKVLPIEIESLLLELDIVADALVSGKPNSITGQSVEVDVVLSRHISEREAKKMIRDYCKDRVSSYKVPTKIRFSDKAEYSDRFKKIRLNKYFEAMN